jgi:hypothetical protein
MPKISALTAQAAPLEDADLFAYVRTSAGTAGSRKTTWAVVKTAAGAYAVTLIQPTIDAIAEDISELEDELDGVLDAVASAFGGGAVTSFGVLTSPNLARSSEDDREVSYSKFAYIANGDTRIVPAGTATLPPFPSNLGAGKWAPYGLFVRDVDGVETVIAVPGGAAPYYDTFEEAVVETPTIFIAENGGASATVTTAGVATFVSLDTTPEVGDRFTLSTTEYTIVSSFNDEITVTPAVANSGQTPATAGVPFKKALPTFVGSVILQADAVEPFVGGTDALAGGTSGNPAQDTVYDNSVAPAATNAAEASAQFIRVPYAYASSGSTTSDITTHTVSAGVTRVDVETWGGGQAAATAPDQVGQAGNYAASYGALVAPEDVLGIYVGATEPATGSLTEGFPSVVLRGVVSGISTTSSATANDDLYDIRASPSLVAAAYGAVWQTPELAAGYGDLIRAGFGEVVNDNTGNRPLPPFYPGEGVGCGGSTETGYEDGGAGFVIIWEYQPV